MTKAVLIVDLINTKIMADKKLLKEIDAHLWEKMATPVIDAHRFTESYKIGLDDGKIHVYNTNTHTFHSGLLKMAEFYLHGGMFDFQVIDKRNKPEKGGGLITKWNDDFKIRSYQFKAIIAAMRKGKGILSLPTGSGKTVIAGKLIKLINQPACFMVHTRTLLYQTQAKLSDLYEKDTPIGIIGDGHYQVHQVNVCSIQTLYAVLSAHYAGKQIVKFSGRGEFKTETIDNPKINKIVKMISEAKVMIFDECHHISADTYTEVARAFTKAEWRFGLSATVWREDKKEIMLHQLLGGIIYELDLDTLIGQGYLVPPKIGFIEPITPHFPDKKYSKKLEGLHFSANTDRNKGIVSTIGQMIENGYNSILVLCKLVNHTIILNAMLTNRGVRSANVTGSITGKKRDAIINAFEAKELQVIVSTDIFGEGFDMPIIDAVVMAHMGKSITKLYQYIGRGLRPSKNKDHTLIIEIADRYKWFGEWFEYRLGAYYLEPVFLENIINEDWRLKIDLLARKIDKGEERIFRDIYVVDKIKKKAYLSSEPSTIESCFTCLRAVKEPHYTFGLLVHNTKKCRITTINQLDKMEVRF